MSTENALAIDPDYIQIASTYFGKNGQVFKLKISYDENFPPTVEDIKQAVADICPLFQ